MSLDFTKVNYIDGSTVIEADNLNNIQDAILALDSNKVENVSGKGLSTEDYTSAEKTKLSGIEAGAQVNPGNATTSADGLMSSADKAKLDGIATGATAVTIDSTLTVAGQAADAKATGDALAEKYEKPSTGIPKTDLASDVQTSLGKADTALQQHQSLADYRTSVDQDTIDAGKQAKISASGLLKGDGVGGVTAAVAGTDYQSPLTAGTDYETPAGAKSLGLSGAEVGDLVRVKTIDANGKPTSWEHVTSSDVTRMCAKADELGFVITGNTCTSSVAVGQYVILRNSTISGKNDGLYTAAKAIPANTALDATYLTAVTDGGLNALSRDTGWISLTNYIDTSTGFYARPGFPPSVRIVNGKIYYNGEVYLKTAASPPTVGYVQVFKNIPAQYHPTVQIMGSGVSFDEFRPYVIFTQPTGAETGGTICLSLGSYAATQEWSGFPLEAMSGRLRVSG